MSLLFSGIVPEGEYAFAARVCVAFLLALGGALYLWNVFSAHGGFSSGVGWRKFLIPLVLIGAAVLFLLETRAVQVEVSSESLTVKAGLFYSKSIPLASVSRSSIVVHPPAARPDLTFRTNGLALPGYKKGWYRDSEGRRVYAAYGSGPYVSFITADGTTIVLGTDDPDHLSSALVRR